MPKPIDVLSPALQWDLAVRTKGPATLALAFAAYAGQFYDRFEFDTLARRVSDLYDRESGDQALAFRASLDRRLCDRYRAPIAWDASAAESDDDRSAA